jgi:hypothetical protein
MVRREPSQPFPLGRSEQVVEQGRKGSFSWRHEQQKEFFFSMNLFPNLIVVNK